MLPSNTDMELYCSNKKALFKTICRSRQWGGLTLGNIDDWLQRNFKDTMGRYFAIKFLLHGLYYTEENIVELLRDGIYHKIIGQQIKNDLVKQNNIHKLRSEIDAEVRVQIDNTLFIPLLNNDKPGESGNSMIRYLTTKAGISSSNTCFHFNIDLSKLSRFRRIIIVDDCLGSGQQLFNFWNNNAYISELKQKCGELGIDIYYLILIGNYDAIIDMALQQSLVGLKIVVCEKITSENRIFNIDNSIWEGDVHEFDQAVTYFDSIEKNYEVPRLGYHGLDFAVFIHNTTPDWSLPIFWRETSEWKPLFKRKNSNDL